MANQEHVEILRQGVDAWSRWRQVNPKVQPDLSGADLSEMDLRGMEFWGADLRRAELSWADLRRVDLSWAELVGANLSWADLRRADLSWADLVGAELSWANLCGANLSEADCTEANLSDANLIEANLGKTDLSEIDLRGANLSDANLSEATGLTQEQIDSARGDRNTRMPEGIQRPARWGKKSENLRWLARFMRAIVKGPRNCWRKKNRGRGSGSDGARAPTGNQE